MTTSAYGEKSVIQNWTYGYLYISDQGSTKIRSYDLDQSNLANMDTTQTIDTGLSTAQFLEDTSNGAVLASIHRGSAGARYTDGRVIFINSGVTHDEHGIEKVSPSIYSTDGVNCSRPIHFALNDKKIAIFCDGFYPAPYNASLQINTTLWIVDENKFGSGAVIYNKTLLLKETTKDTNNDVNDCYYYLCLL
jgi:hypothetical protein